MPDYAKMYYLLFNAITDALALMEKHRIKETKEVLIHAQQNTEAVYIDATEKSTHASQ